MSKKSKQQKQLMNTLGCLLLIMVMLGGFVVFAPYLYAQPNYTPTAIAVMYYRQSLGNVYECGNASIGSGENSTVVTFTLNYTGDIHIGITPGFNNTGFWISDVNLGANFTVTFFENLGEDGWFLWEVQFEGLAESINAQLLRLAAMWAMIAGFA